MKRESITTLPASPSADRRRRMVKYSVMMGVRTICLILVFFVPPGIYSVLCIIGAVVLPYIAVLLANAVQSPVSRPIENPVRMIDDGPGSQ